MTLQLDVDVGVSKNANQLFNLLASFFNPTLLQGGGKWSFRASGQTDEAVGVLFQFFFANCTFAFFRA